MPNILNHGNGLEQVLGEYQDHTWRILFNKPKDAEGCSILTPAQSKGYAYYRAAIQTVQALIDAPTPEWVGATGKFVRLRHSCLWRGDE